MLVDDERLGRVVAVTGADGRGVCVTHHGPHLTMHQPVVETTCVPELDAAGISWSLGFDPASFSVYGLATDSVDEVRITTASGRTDTAVLARNVYRWSTTDVTDPPVMVASTTAGETVQLEVPRVPGVPRS